MIRKIKEYLRTMRNRKYSRARRFVHSEFMDSLNHSRALMIFLPMLVWAVCSLLLYWQLNLRANEEEYVLGQRAQHSLESEMDFFYFDREAAKVEEEHIRNNKTLYFRIDHQVQKAIVENVSNFFRAVENRGDALTRHADYRPLPGDLAGTLVGSMEIELFNVFFHFNSNQVWMNWLRRELDGGLNRGILPDRVLTDMTVQNRELRIIDDAGRESEIRRVSDQPSAASFAALLADEMLKRIPERIVKFKRDYAAERISEVFVKLIGADGDMILDEAATEAALAEYLLNRPNQQTEVKKGESLIKRGDTVTETFLEKHKAYLEKRIQSEDEADFKWHILAKTVLVFILVIFFSFYLYHINPDTISTNRRIALLSFMVIVSVMGVFLGNYLFKYVQAQTPEIIPFWMLPFFLPLGLVAVLSAVMMGYRAAIFSGFFVVSVAALMVDESFSFVLRGMTVCAFAGLYVRGARNYRAFFFRTAGILVPLIILINAPIYDIYLTGSWRYFHFAILLAVANALVTAMSALFMVFLMELVFNVTTNMSLMVLCDYNHPLLERMKREAPGTFFHSQMVATIAEDAARAIEANPLRAKAAALYHDIGKIYKPQYFIENVSSADNPHAELNPQLSSIIIRDHVKEGLELAGRYKLCRVVRESIAQHHGNDLVRYFYNKAQKEGDKVVEADFRYTGEPPVEKEVTIVSLADMCEAASRSLEKPSPSKIEELINNLFAQRFAERQLTNSKLTLEELEKVRVSFIHTIVGMRHGRISYK